MTQEALKLALDALIWTTGSGDFGEGGYAHEGAKKCLFPAITAIKEALAQTQEPVADDFFRMIADRNPKPFPLPQRTWVGLTKGEVYDLYDSDYIVFHQRIEAKLKDKNCVG